MPSFITNERLLRFIEDGDIEDALNEPLQPPPSQTERIKQLFGEKANEDNLISTMTLGKFLYDYLRIDPKVVQGIDFASKEQFNTLFHFAHFAKEKVDGGILHNSGALERLKGYVGEQFAAWHLQAKGHEILWPNTSNNPGWDILVDGMPFQIKCVTDPSAILTHFSKYPDIPVIVNKEMGQYVGGMKNVHVIPTLSENEVLDATRNTLQHGKNLTNFEIPWMTVVVTSSAAVKNLIMKKTDLSGAFATVLIDTASITGAGLAGKYIAMTLGSFFGPCGTVIGSILGQVAGGRAGRPISNEVKQLFLQDQIKAIYRGVSAVLITAADEIDNKLDCKDEKESILDRFIRATRANSYVKGTVKENFQEDRRYLRNKKNEMLSYAKDPQSMFSDPLKAIEDTCIMTTQAGVHPQCIQTQWEQVSDALADYEWQVSRFSIKL